MPLNDIGLSDFSNLFGLSIAFNIFMAIAEKEQSYASIVIGKFWGIPQLRNRASDLLGLLDGRLKSLESLEAQGPEDAQQDSLAINRVKKYIEDEIPKIEHSIKAAYGNPEILSTASLLLVFYAINCMFLGALNTTLGDVFPVTLSLTTYLLLFLSWLLHLPQTKALIIRYYRLKWAPLIYLACVLLALASTTYYNEIQSFIFSRGILLLAIPILPFLNGVLYFIYIGLYSRTVCKDFEDINGILESSYNLTNQKIIELENKNPINIE